MEAPVVTIMSAPGAKPPQDKSEAAVTKDDAGKATVAADKVLSASSNLARLLPTGSVLAYQSLSASFTNQGECYHSNFWLGVYLVVFLTASCIFFAFTDSIVYKGKVYYGVAVPGRLNIFNLDKKEEKEVFDGLLPELDKHDVVFLTVVGSDVGLQKCFFPHAGTDTKQLLKNMPLGMAVLSSFVFLIFPTTRRGIGSHSQISYDSSSSSSSSSSHGKTRSDGKAPLPPSTLLERLGAPPPPHHQPPPARLPRPSPPPFRRAAVAAGDGPAQPDPPRPPSLSRLPSFPNPSPPPPSFSGG